MLQQYCCFEVIDQCYNYVLPVLLSPAILMQLKAIIDFLELLLTENTEEFILIGPFGWVLFCFVRGDEKIFSI